MTNGRPEPERAAASESESSMFSAASFSALLSERGADALTPAVAVPRRPVIAFYGFRGGAGRTTALAHVAALLASRQVSVVAVDLDLEAPGLHHVLSCPPAEQDRGVLALLRAAATVTIEGLDDALRLAPHVVRSALDVGTPIRVLPAGQLSAAYLARLDDLGVPVWHLMQGPSPLEALVRRIQSELDPQVTLLDCRTGLSGLSASAVFHISDVVLCFLPVSVQSIDGLDTFLQALRSARGQRAGLPEALFVPSMVPEGPEGQERLAAFVEEVTSRYLRVFPPKEDDIDSAEDAPVVREGLEYRAGIALTDSLRTDFVQRSGGAYRGLLRALDDVLSFDVQPEPPAFNTRLVLDQLDRAADLEALAFAESADLDLLVKKFIEPTDFNAIIDRSTWYVVGSKGSGKTWLWRYLLSETGKTKIRDTTLIAGHGPQDESLSESALREIERDARLKTQQSYPAFWLLYAAHRVLSRFPNLLRGVDTRLSGEERRLIGPLAEPATASPRRLQAALTKALKNDRVGTLAEEVIRGLDAELLASGSLTVALLYDGLDTGFGSASRDIARRKTFVNGLATALEKLRGVSKRVAFKVFLREDIYSEIDIQNQSHLDAAKVELQWRPGDLWTLALNVVSTSDEYQKALRSIDPGAGPGQWPHDAERLQRLLTPLWGDRMERGRKVSTARFIQRRTADGLDRLFPRTLVQLLAKAVQDQLRADPVSDRVLRSASIQQGYNEASKLRVDDLRKEYIVLAPYLAAIESMKPTGTESEIETHMKKRLQSLKRSPSVSRRTPGAAAGALHAGAGGWRKVIERLREVGVLREYRRARGEGGATKYEIALLYRPGLGIRAFGI
jgi:MinD-like ATPase involved in chromosome partitioning or flagellar assembly